MNSEDKKLLLEEKRKKVVEFIKTNGPALPIQIARILETTTLFSSAILSEMTASKILKTSHLKVGGSPVYFLPGQEHELEKFTKYLAGKEKESFELLKKNSVLQDEKLQPAHRIALRNTRDFAIPLKIKTNGEEKIFWYFYGIGKEEAIKKIKKLIGKKIGKPRMTKKIEEREKAEEVREDEFFEKINSYIEKNNIFLKEEKIRRKKEFCAFVSVHTSLGKIDFLLIAKNKKNINEADLRIALSKGSEFRMPVLFLASGKLTKKALAEIENFKSYLIFRQLQ